MSKLGELRKDFTRPTKFDPKTFLIEGLLDQGWQEMAQNNWGFKC